MKARSCELLAEPVERQLKMLDAPGDWQWVVLDEKDWRQATGRFHVAEQSANAFTVLQLRITFLSEEYLQRNRPLPVLDVLAHELGHIRCVCGSEREARRLGAEMLVAVYDGVKKSTARP